MPSYIFEISLNLPEMGKDEALAIISSYDIQTKVMGIAYNGLLLKTDRPLPRIEKRFGLIREYSSLIGIYSSPEELEIDLLRRVLNGKKYYIEVERDPKRYSSEFSRDLCRKIAKNLVSFAKVSFKDPDVILKIYLGKSCALGIKIGERPKEVTKFKGNSFPFTRPVIMDRRLARAMINLTRIKEGSLFLDPMCGTGTFLIEAGKMGMRVIGADIDPVMIKGAKKNLDHFKILPVSLLVSDVSELPKKVEKVDGIATDPPYGRSSSTFGKDLQELYHSLMSSAKEMLGEGQRISVIFPKKDDHLKIGAKYLRLISIYSQKVHKGLTRYIGVYEK